MRSSSRRRPAQRPAAPTSAAPAAPRFADRLVECATCGRMFVFPIEEQRRLAAAGLLVEPPAHCPEHRALAAEPEAGVAALETAHAPVAPPAEDEFGGLYTVRSTGRVKWYDAEKGYGFITSDDDGREYFVHQSALEGGVALSEGQAVEFELERKAKGAEAAYVLPL